MYGHSTVPAQHRADKLIIDKCGHSTVPAQQPGGHAAEAFLAMDWWRRAHHLSHPSSTPGCRSSVVGRWSADKPTLGWFSMVYYEWRSGQCECRRFVGQTTGVRLWMLFPKVLAPPVTPVEVMGLRRCGRVWFNGRLLRK